MLTYLIYGANGYSGALIARAAKAAGHTPVLAGRREAALQPLAAELGLPYRAFALDDPAAVDAGLAGVPLVLHCAGPFSSTSRPMADACLRRRAHYLDITGEFAVFEALAARDAEAKRAGVVLLPGVGFDVVPSDCLAAHLKRRLPSATHLRLAIQPPLSMSRGTATSTIESAGLPNFVRRGGVLTPEPAGALARTIDFGFGSGPTFVVSIPWGDVSTAFHSTGIPDIEVYAAVPRAARAMLRVSGVFRPLLQSRSVQRFLKQRAQRGAEGPDESARTTRVARLWGEAFDGTRRVESRLLVPEPYHLTVLTALASVEQLLGGPAAAGFRTPSLAFGADFIMKMNGVERRDD
jgi:short subunit dehydrogenase-like uncharacterized protein